MGKFLCLSGEKGIGKSYLIENIIKECKEKKIRVSGYYTRGQTVRSFVNVNDGTEWAFNEGKGNHTTIGKFIITDKAFEFAINALNESNTDLVIIDEIGRLEFNKKGLYTELMKFFQSNKHTILAVCRYDYLDLINEIFNIDPEKVWIIEKRDDQDYLMNKILNEVITK